MTARARVRLAFVGMHPVRRADLEDRLGGPAAVVEAIVQGEIDVPERARVTAARSAAELLAGLPAGIRLVLAGHAGYPNELLELGDRPDALFVRGEVLGGDAVAIVGSRAATRYGVGVAEALGRRLADAGYVVVSGLARGIDAAAHRGAIDSTMAVFGCGIDRWYPSANRALGHRILEAGGGLISEYAPGTPPAPWRFPLRNRIVSGLVRAVVVVEAAVTGGALITARAALAQGRDVLAVPGDLGRPTSEGCNKLIADGALPVTSIEDAVEALDVVCGRLRVPRRSEHPLAELLGDTGVDLDELVRRLGTPLGEVLVRVGRWEVEGLARLDAGRVVPA
jgi:DNA processing protein